MLYFSNSSKAVKSLTSRSLATCKQTHSKSSTFVESSGIICNSPFRKYHYRIDRVLLELLSKGIEHGHVHLHGEISNKELIVIFIGLAIHSFIEGMPINTFESSVHQHTITNINSSFSSIYLSTILIHKLPIAAVLIIFLNSINSSYLKKFVFLFLFAASSPLGGIVGELIVNIDFFKGFSLNLLAISCGMLLHITTLLIFEDHHNSKGKIKNILTISAGIVTGILIFSI